MPPPPPWRRSCAACPLTSCPPSLAPSGPPPLRLRRHRRTHTPDNHARTGANDGAEGRGVEQPRWRTVCPRPVRRCRRCCPRAEGGQGRCLHAHPAAKAAAHGVQAQAMAPEATQAGSIWVEIVDWLVLRDHHGDHACCRPAQRPAMRKDTQSQHSVQETKPSISRSPAKKGNWQKRAPKELSP